MTNHKRRQREAEFARLETALPPDVVERVLENFDVPTLRLPASLMPAAKRLREIAREFANA